MKEGWDVKELGEVTIVGAGNSAPQKKELFVNGKFPFIRTSDVGKIRKGSINSSVDYLNTEGVKKLKLFKKGTILFPKSGASTFLNHRVIMDIDGYVSSHLATIKSKEILEDRFVWYYLRLIDAKDLMQDIAYPSLKLSDIKQIQIPLPPLQEQQHIVAILDKTFEAIEKAKANAEQNLKNSKELFENATQLLFDDEKWEYKKLGEIASFKNGMNFTKSSKGQSVEIVGVRNFKNKFWVPFEELDKVVLDGEMNDTYQLKEGDIITVRSNGNPKLIGRTLLADKVNGKVSHSGFTIRIRLNPNTILPIFLCNYLKTNRTRKELVDSGNGVGIKSLNQGSLSSLKVPYPKSIKEQNLIVDQIEKLSIEVNKLDAVYQQKIVDLEELKKSILNKAFKGEL